VPLIKAICSSEEKKAYATPEPLKGGPEWDIDKQKAMCAEIADAIGFDFKK
jgi:hypothetical protein